MIVLLTSHVGTKPHESVVIRSRDDGMFWNVREYIIMSVNDVYICPCAGSQKRGRYRDGNGNS